VAKIVGLEVNREFLAHSRAISEGKWFAEWLRKLTGESNRTSISGKRKILEVELGWVVRTESLIRFLPNADYASNQKPKSPRGDTRDVSAGRFAPSPSGDLHLGNLRTALLAWLCAKSTGRQFLIRVEDLDQQRCKPKFEVTQLADLAALGIESEGPIVRQSERLHLYERAIERLVAEGRTYECFCTRREILEAASAPHQRAGAYPGTCRELSESNRARLRLERPGALRLRADAEQWTVEDLLHGPVVGHLDDLVIRRNDGTPAYNLAVVLDDAWQDGTQVVRGDDLLFASPPQAYLASVLRVNVPEYVHVPLVLNAEGKRLAKRDGAVTLRDLAPEKAWHLIVESLGLGGDTPAEVLESFSLDQLPREPWVFVPDVSG